MININKIFIKGNIMILEEPEKKEVFTLEIQDISRIRLFLSSNDNYEIKCILAFGDKIFSFFSNITINYFDFLDIMDYSNIRNFKAFLLYLKERVDDNIIDTETLHWLINNASLPKDKECPDDPKLKLAIAKLSLMELNAKLKKKTHRRRIEVFLFICLGLLSIILGYILGYRQYLHGNFPFFYFLCFIGLFLVIIAFLPKKRKQY